MQELKILAEWISKNYSSAEVIVEIGIGNTKQVMVELRNNLPDCELIATDVREVPAPQGVKFVTDDVTDPRLSIYQGADLIFSVRPSPDLYASLYGLANEVEADLLIKPASSEESPRKGELVNFSGVFFYILY